MEEIDQKQKREIHQKYVIINFVGCGVVTCCNCSCVQWISCVVVDCGFEYTNNRKRKSFLLKKIKQDKK